MATAAFRRHRKRRGEGPPSSSYSLTSSLDGRRVSPLVLGLHGMGGARAPPRLDLSLCLSLFLRSRLLPIHRFVYIWRSVTPIGLKHSPSFFFLKISFLAAKEEQQPAYGWPTRGAGAPPASCPPRAPSRVDSSSHILQIFQKYSLSIWIPFDMGFLRNIKHATNRNWHWALDQYVSPKNSIKSCQKYMKVV